MTARLSFLAIFVLGTTLTTQVKSANAQDVPKANPEAKILLQVVGHVSAAALTFTGPARQIAAPNSPRQSP